MTRQEVEQVIIANLPDNPNPKVRTAKHREVEFKILDYIDDGLSSVASGIKGEATPSTVPSGVGFEIYNVSTVGTYTNFKDSSSTAIEITQSDLDSGLVQLWGQDGVWEKHITAIDLSGYIKPEDVIDDLITKDPEKPLSANMGVLLNDQINIASKIPTYEDVGNYIQSRSVNCNTGGILSSPNYEYAPFVAVVPGSYISFTGVVAGISGQTNPALGVAGYDDSKVFLNTLDDDGLPIGNLWGKDRYAIESGTSPSVSRMLFTDKLIKIPEGCYYIRACSAVGEAAPGDLTSPLSLKTPQYDADSITVIDKIIDVENEIPEQVAESAMKINANNIVSITDRITTTDPKITVYKDSVSYPGGVIGGICLAVKAMLVQPAEGPFYVLRSDGSYSQTYNITPDVNMTSNYGVFLDLDVMQSIAEPITGAGYVPVDLMHEGLFITKDMNSKTDYKKSNQLLLMQYYYGEYLFSPYFSQKIADFLSGGSGDSVNGFALMQDEVEDIAFANSFYRDDSNVLQKRFTFAHISDIHPNSLNAIKNTDAAIAFTKRAKIGQQLNALICTGDICNGNAGRDKSIALSEMRSVVTRLTDASQSLLSCTLIGNHDTNVNEAGSSNPSGSYTQALNKGEQYTEMIKPFADRFSQLNTQTGKCYFYFDEPDDKIRFIALDSYDYEAAPDATDPTKLHYSVGFIYSQAQLDWLYNTLNSTPSDYGLVVLTHGPHIPGWTVGTYRQGTDLIPSVIQAYKNGTSFTHSWDGGPYPEYETSKVFDFTSKGESEVIMWICGHAHTRKVIKYMDVNVIQTHCLFTDEDVFVAGHTKSVDSVIPKRNGTATESSFNIYSIDRREKKIYLTCYGAYRDDKGEFTDRLVVIDY